MAHVSRSIRLVTVPFVYLFAVHASNWCVLPVISGYWRRNSNIHKTFRKCERSGPDIWRTTLIAPFCSALHQNTNHWAA